jgi:catechol 2,3-dioxygenase-like lactoylglutathione lyase family enzyme
VAGLLRLQAVTLPVPDLGKTEKFYRWVLGMRDAAPRSEERATLGWEREDRIVLVDAAIEGPEEAVTLGLPAMTVEAAGAWLAERGLTLTTALVPPGRETDARSIWPEATVDPYDDGLILKVHGPVEPRIDLHVPLSEDGPSEAIAGGSTALEVPGLLGVTTGAPDARAAQTFLARFGIEPLESSGEAGPLLVGNQQWIVEERDPGGIYGIAVVVELDRIKDLGRTLARLGAEYRHEGNRLLALDPAGRVLLVHGLKGG